MTIGRVSNAYNYIDFSAAGRVGSLSRRSHVDRVSPVETKTSGFPGGVFTNSDGDRAEISGRASNLFRQLVADNAIHPPPSPTIQNKPGFILDVDFDLPSPFVTLADFRGSPGSLPDFRDFAPVDIPDNNIPTFNVTPNITPQPIIFQGGVPPTGAPGNQSPGERIASAALEELMPSGSCETCANRRYVDQSDDPSVSFQTPTKISPNMAAAAVASHEQEHVRNEQAKAHRDDREIISQTVTLTYDCCPECGKHYVSGGTTRTTSISRSDADDENMSGDQDQEI